MIEREHPKVVNDYPGVSKPKKLIMGFGARWLDFGLGAFIRDVDNWL